MFFRVFTPKALFLFRMARGFRDKSLGQDACKKICKKQCK